MAYLWTNQIFVKTPAIRPCGGHGDAFQ